MIIIVSKSEEVLLFFTSIITGGCMAFVAAYWWLWLLLGALSIVFLIFSSLRKYRKLKKDKDLNNEKLGKAAVMVLAQMILTWVFVVACWFTFLVSLAINIIQYVVHLTKS